MYVQSRGVSKSYCAFKEKMIQQACLVPRPHYSVRPKRLGLRGPSENVRRFPPVHQALGKRRTGKQQEKLKIYKCMKIARYAPLTFSNLLIGSQKVA